MNTTATQLPTVGQTYRWETGLTFTVLAIHEDPQAAFAGNRLNPYLTVQWSDATKPESYSIRSFQSDLKDGSVELVEAGEATLGSAGVPIMNIQKGDRVEVQVGPLAGQEGFVKAISQDKRYATVRFISPIIRDGKVSVNNLTVTTFI